MLQYRDAVTHLRYRPQLLIKAHYTRGPSICKTPCHVVPHTGAHVNPRCCVALCHVAAPCASCAPLGLPAALPRGLRAVSRPRGGPARHVLARRLPRSPRQHLQVNTPFLRFLNKKIQLKKQIKIGKRLKLPKMIS